MPSSNFIFVEKNIIAKVSYVVMDSYQYDSNLQLRRIMDVAANYQNVNNANQGLKFNCPKAAIRPTGLITMCVSARN
jgi:hypothetical protein